MPKNCINCGCPVSGEGKNKAFCDDCLKKVSPFLKFISTSKVPAVKLYETNEEKLRGMGLSEMSLAYLSKCCSAYDEKKAAAVAAVTSTAPASFTITPDADSEIKFKPIDTPESSPEKPDREIIASAAAIAAAIDAQDAEAEAAADSSEPPTVQYSVVDALGGGGDGDGDDPDMYDEPDGGDGGKRITLIITAAVLTLIIFLALYIGKILPGYNPDGKDTTDGDTPSIADTSDTSSDDSTDTTDIGDNTTDTDYDTSETADYTTDTDDDTTDTDDDTTDTDDDTTDTDDDTTDTDAPDTTDDVTTDCTHNYEDATCTDPETCSRCGETRGDALGHDYGEATCTEPETCSRCDDTRGDALGHEANEATCTEASVCSRCEETVTDALGHDYSDATCTEAAKCSRCGETEGEALGHDWQEATCTEPKKCSRCSETEGDPLGHAGGAMCVRCGKYMVTLSAIGSPITATTDNGDEYSVTVNTMFTTKSDNGTLISFEFKIDNPNADSINSGGFKVFYVDADGVYHGKMIELWETVNPGESLTKTLEIFIDDPDATPVVLEYYPNEAELAGMSSPHGDGQGAFFWKIS